MDKSGKVKISGGMDLERMKKFQDRIRFGKTATLN